MLDQHDPHALIRHAADAGDWRLVELLARVLTDRVHCRSPGTHRAYLALVRQLGLM